MTTIDALLAEAKMMTTASSAKWRASLTSLTKNSLTHTDHDAACTPIYFPPHLFTDFVCLSNSAFTVHLCLRRQSPAPKSGTSSPKRPTRLKWRLVSSVERTTFCSCFWLSHRIGYVMKIVIIRTIYEDFGLMYFSGMIWWGLY